jgi:hypothetical protein
LKPIRSHLPSDNPDPPLVGNRSRIADDSCGSIVPVSNAKYHYDTTKFDSSLRQKFDGSWEGQRF